MAKLFKNNIIREKLSDFEIPNMDEKLKIIWNWLKLHKDGVLQAKKEEELESPFWDDFFGKILGYESLTESDIYSRKFQPKVPEWGQKADIGLWIFSEEDNIMKVIVELKDAKTSLDKPQQRAGNLTPVQQAFKYKPYFRECDFIIVSNFVETRIYIDSYYDYESFTLESIANPTDNYFEFRKFYFLLCKNNLITKSWDSNTKSLLSAIRSQEKEITKEFYKDYSLLRKELFKDIVSNNTIKKTELDLILNKTQKIIDRIIFIHFCEDIGLLPNGKLKENILRAEEIDIKPWEMLKKFFEFVNSGSEKLGIPDWYNGGLFKKDEYLEKLKVGDDICRKFIDLGDYDFQNDLSVNILGHIFEQSISDIEEIKEKLKSDEEIGISKRKKDGIFYTPEYIVDYIVKNSVGKKVDEWEEELKAKHSLNEEITDKNYEKRAILVYSELQEKVQNIKVLDPACGSGAFLVKVFDFLLDKNREIAKKLEDLSGTVNMQNEDYLKSILQNCIYGVDLNEESVEITKLSLWLKTAQKGKKLANLDSNIKCGNSLIDDKTVAGNKAFKWEEEFGEIMKNGGFDVIVGNPPYVLCQPSNTNEDTLNYYKNTYQVSSYKIDLYHLFFEKSINILQKWWELGFITPNTYFTNKHIATLRSFILSQSNIEKVILFEDNVFVWASVDTSIILLQKNAIFSENIIFIWIMNAFWEINEREWKKQSSFSSTEDKEFNFNKTFDFQKILEDTLRLEKIMKVYFWIQAYSKKDSTFTEKTRENYLPIIDWWDIKEFSISEYKNFFDYKNENIKSWWDFNVYKNQRIVISQIWKVPKVWFCYGWILTSNTIYNLYLDNNNFDIRYILALLNSRFIQFYWNENFSDNKQLFPKIKWYQLKQLPIKNIPLSEQQPFIEKADFMLQKNKELQEKLSASLQFLKTRFSLEKTNGKLEKFYELDFADFKKALGIKKISMTEEEDLMNWFHTKKNDLMVLKNQIDTCDKEIDEMVFDLYGLSEEERRVVLGV